ncbi:SGNH/GDSL hydrolase family protein [Acinetobacter indicus]|uniref:SGNH/GDSL hydrolase family protein n=1 Tax=Acinetobacter indicus TaxID=756892 RepID=UPI00209ACE31|nr:SGNH/GDSL hydrolase family protein [Acinetobacter indicus]MCO8100114.1 SGNH/GDSL hydrolase family protein [Acinetobacter indicus]MCO8105641.1 SGNH/GDSL hydrolase family protein [Acinetobacter indicus]MCO8111315.1 SGNH/GDSL hydrolase family protein [Acinetobacter indicus]
MTMFLAPYTAIADIDGSPLDAGFIYFGEFGKNPETHPIPVYWDADFAVPAAQPIRTRNGYPIRNGSPCKIYLKQAEHSLVVKNKNLSAILVEMNNKGISSSLLVRPDGNTVETSLVEIDAALDTKASSEYVDNQVGLMAPQATTYTKTEVDSALSLKAPQSSTYTKSEVDTAFAAYVGGRKAYTTLALAQAAQSSLPANTAIEVTNDGANNGTYQWNGTTLTKSAYDPLTQAKHYADQKTRTLITSQFYNFNDVATIISGSYISELGVQTSAANWSCSAFLPVEEFDEIGYSATANDVVAFIAGYDKNQSFLRDLAPIVGGTLTVSAGKITIPSDVKFVRVSFYSANSTSYSFSLYPFKIAESALDIPVIADSVFSELLGSVNLFDPATAMDGKYILDNVISNLSTWFVSDFIPVTGGETYITNGAATGSNGTGVHYYDSAKAYLGNGAKQAANSPFVVPDGVSFIRLNYTKSASQPIADTFVVAGTEMKEDRLKQKIASEVSNLVIDHRYSGKTLMTFGDSITASASTPYTYPPKVAAHFGMNLFDAARSGSRVRSSFASTTIASNANILASHVCTIAHGTNDFKLETALGSISDAPTPRATLDDPAYRDNANTTGTFYADYRGVIESILAINPNARIMLITPIRRTQPAATGTDTNARGHKLIDYVNAIKEIGDYYGLPVLDNYNTSGFNAITILNWTTDGLHPTQWAQENVLVNKVIGFIESN